MDARAVSARGSLTPPTLRRSAAVAVFLGGSAAAIYAPNAESAALGALALAAFALFHVACGALIGRWWAPLLPALVVLIAIPSERDHEVPFWFDYLVFLAIPAALLLGAGVAIGRIVRSRRRSRLMESLQT